MKLFTRILKWTFIVLAILVLGLVVTVYARKDRKFDAPYPDIHASKDSAVIARGKYLVTGLAHCPECHANMAEMPKVERGEEVALSGGMNFVLPGVATIYAPNITPDEETGIGKLTDGEIARALRYGVRHDGKAILDFMPFYHLSDEDLTAVISYIRASKPVKNKRPEHETTFVGKAIMAFLIKPMGDGRVDQLPAIDTTAAYGKYIAENVSNCKGCHSKRDMQTGAFIGPLYAGGMQFELFDSAMNVIPGKHWVTPNLTPDPETGRITAWSQEQFVNRIHTGRLLAGSPMPWGPFSRMTDVEAIAIYKYLRSLQPVKNETEAGLQEGDPK